MTHHFADGESWKTGSDETRENKAVYLEWLLTPPAVREPRTKAALADRLGRTTQTLRNYEKDPQFQAELAQRRRNVVKVDDVGNIIATLVARATDAEAGAAGNAAAKIVLDWAEKQTSEMNAEALRALSDDEVKAMLVAMYNDLDKADA